MFKKIDTNAFKKDYKFDLIAGTLTPKQKRTKVAYLNKRGYWVLQRQGVKYYVHRVLAQLASKKDISNFVVDHLNYDTTDNRIENLRLTTQRNNVIRKRTTGKRKLRYRGIVKKNYTYGVRYLGKVTVNGKAMYSPAQKTQKAAYVKHLQMFCRYNGIENLPPKMLKDYLAFTPA